jgi:hypothetical protein
MVRNHALRPSAHPAPLLSPRLPRHASPRRARHRSPLAARRSAARLAACAPDRAAAVTEAEVQKLYRAFKRLDEDGSGQISRSEFMQVRGAGRSRRCEHER